MSKFILGKKLHMTQKFLADGTVVPVTIVEAGPCTVTQVKGEKDGYTAVQVGFGKKRVLNKPLAGHLKNLANFRYLREFRLDKADDFSRGKVFDASSFKIGDILTVTAISKGKGFQGVVKRHHFSGSLATHGHKDQVRMPGSIGSTEPARVFKGTRMAGRMGGDQVTVKNLELVEIDPEKNYLYIKGAVPGARNNLVVVVADGEISFVEKTSAAPEPEAKVSEAPAEDKTEEKVEAPIEADNKIEEKSPETAEVKAEDNSSESLPADKSEG
ncbi:MAG: 50S ribosomal protein L3 [Patescibacteria group bacterium]